MKFSRLALPAIVMSALAGGCELFVIGGGGGTRNTVVEISQRSAPGVVYLFKAELDSANTTAATELMLHTSGRRLLAVEKYEMADDLARWQRILKGKPITSHVVDTLSPTMQNVTATFDYLRAVSFATVMVDDAWYITRIQDVRR